jgi:glycyl-tRNA synthetase
MSDTKPTMQDIVSLAKQRGFIFPASEIYGGLGGTYTYGPLGVELKNNIKQLWWEMFVQKREDIVGIDGPILLHPRLWEASGHTTGFNDAMVDCKQCKRRFRADHVVEDATGKDLEGQLDEMSNILKEEKIPCPVCGKSDWTDARTFNMMFKTSMANIVDEEGKDVPVYLRPETAGAIFVEFKNVVDSMRPKMPFGIAQIGKAFRNEIVANNFIFRLREFEQMEIEYFIHPKAEWEPLFEGWLEAQEAFLARLGVAPEDLRRREHAKEKLSHYSRKTVDIEYNFPFGFKELYGLAHRSDFDLTQHATFSGQKLEYTDPHTGERFVPHVLEPTFGVDRTVLVTILSAYTKEKVGDNDERVVLKFPPRIAPVKVAVFPLLKNKPQLIEKARAVYTLLSKDIPQVVWDDNGNVGKRYRRQDEIGTPYCVTIDFDTIEDDTVTVRDRDTMTQKRVEIADLVGFIKDTLQ